MKYSKCQSCGMPLDKDPKRGAINTDGSKNEMYCSYCYENGEFTQPDITLPEMKNLVKNKMKDMGFPGFLASFFARGISRLERWK